MSDKEKSVVADNADMKAQNALNDDELKQVSGGARQLHPSIVIKDSVLKSAAGALGEESME